MRIIPKRIKVRNTVWKCYSMPDVIVALIAFSMIFIAITAGNFVLAILLGRIAVVMFMPTQEGIFYSCILENIKFLCAKKEYTKTSGKEKENVRALFPIKEIRESGLIVYDGGVYSRVMKIGQKNFGIEDLTRQNIDIDYFANALKQLEGTQSADIVKIDRPIRLDEYSSTLFRVEKGGRWNSRDWNEIAACGRDCRMDVCNERGVCVDIV